MLENLYTYKINNVIKNYDGDTVTVVVDLGFHITRQETVRLLDIDTDEIRGGTDDSKARARQARDRLAQLLNMGQCYITTQKDDTGKYGRLLGWLFVQTASGDVIDVNKTLVAEGYSKGETRPLTESIQYIG